MATTLVVTSNVTLTTHRTIWNTSLNGSSIYISIPFLRYNVLRNDNNATDKTHDKHIQYYHTLAGTVQCAYNSNTLLYSGRNL